MCCRMGKNRTLLTLLNNTLKQYGALSKAVNTEKSPQAHILSQQWLPRGEEMNGEGKAIISFLCFYMEIMCALLKTNV